MDNRSKLSPKKDSLYGLLSLVGIIACVASIPYLSKLAMSVFHIASQGVLYLCSLSDYINFGLMAIMAWAFLTLQFAAESKDYKFANKVIWGQFSVLILNFIFAIGYMNSESVDGYFIGAGSLIVGVVSLFGWMLMADNIRDNGRLNT